MGKGEDFEREICPKLSLWWTQDHEHPRDDVFWRASGSGNRATFRAKQGKTTFGQYGDLAATHPCGRKLIRFMTVDMKRGYNAASIHLLLDGKGESAGEIAGWVEKMLWMSEQAGSLGWVIIHRRDYRDALIYMSESIHEVLTAYSFFSGPISHVMTGEWEFYVMRFDHWLEAMKPEYIRTALGGRKS